MTDDREKNLPKWAREELAVLRMRLREQTLRAEQAEATAGFKGEGRSSILTPIRPSDRIRFGPDFHHTSIDVWVARQATHGPVLEIMGGSRLRLELSSSNVLFVSTVDADR